MHALYHTTACPDKIVGLILIKLHADLATHSSTTRLARLVFLLGQTALCTLVYTEKIANITKKFMENEKTNSKSSKRKSVGSSGTSVAATAASALKTPAVKKTRNISIGGRNSVGGLEEAEEMEMEMGLAASADADHEMVSE